MPYSIHINIQSCHMGQAMSYLSFTFFEIFPKIGGCMHPMPPPPPPKSTLKSSLHQIRRYPAPYISKAGQKATPSNILQPFIPHCFPLQSPYINSRPFISSPHYFYSSPIRFRICPTPAQPTSILTRIVFPADQQPILNDQFYVEEMPEEIVIVVKLIYSDRTHST